MNDPSPRLSLSAIIWDRAPTVWCAGDDYDEPLGTYSEAANVTLLKGNMNTELAAIEYTPATPQAFVYMRHAYVGADGSTVTYEGGVFGENMSPLIRISLPDRRSWPERFRRSDNDIERNRMGPPFQFFADDWQGSNGIDPEYTLQKRSVVLVPDVPNQSLQNMEPVGDSGHEQDSTVHLGWHGTWATALLENRDRHHPLGNMTNIFWDSAGEWGVELHLQVISVNEVELSIYEEQDEDSDPPESRGVESYKVRATILRAFVKSPWFIRARQLEEAESQDEENSSGSEGEHENDVEWM